MEYGKYIVYLIVLTLVGYLFDKYNLHNQREEDERHYNLVNKFLLTDSSMLNNLPIIWIHASTGLQIQDIGQVFIREIQQI